MNDSTIGIKIANRSYFPIIAEKPEQRKRLVLTTVNDNQTSVQIDLYRGDGKDLENALYIGSLIIDNIEPTEKGNPEIELILGVDSEKNLNASAADVRTGEKQSLSVSLDALGTEELYDIPDFDFDTSFDPVEEPEPEQEEKFYTESAVIQEPLEEDVRRSRPWLIILLIILGLIILGAAGFFIYRSFAGGEIPPLRARQDSLIITENTEDQPGTAEMQPEETGPVQDGAAADEPAADEPAAAEAADETGPSAVPGQEPEKLGGAWYWIKRGDTLWDLSASFYRTPWRYGVIARWNGIENPDLIFAGSKIFIPEL